MDTARTLVRAAQDDGVLTVTLDYPEKRNALSLELREELIAVLDRAEGDAAVRAIVITGAGGVFCSGGDISSMDVRGVADARERLRRIQRLISLMIKGSKPIVAAVEGWCVGAGLSLACACDTVVAATDARFMSGFTKIGLMPDLGLLYTLPARVGMGPARQMLLRNHSVLAADAFAMGLVDRVVEPDRSLPEAQALAREFAQSSPLAVAQIKAFLAEGIDSALERERQAQTLLFLTDDHEAGREAFLAKRNPVFRGE